MEKALICGLFDSNQKEPEIQILLDEMTALAESAGAAVAARTFQKRESPDRSTLVGSGKVDEIKSLIGSLDLDLVIFCNTLNNMQQRNLENSLNIKVIDRTRLILDIFATRARSMEGKLQVELAQLLYLLPRLTGKGIAMSRLGGGIGTRGPGESKLEADRRTIRKKISQIKEKLEKVSLNRGIHRHGRQSSPVPVVSLVGYTSAGKSTLFKSLTGENVFISSQLFSTLDPLLRRVDLHEIETGTYFLLADTVGFIRQMPKELFSAFKATLEEITVADIILHIVDLADPDHLEHRREVEKVLQQIGVEKEKILTVFNKIDRIAEFSPLTHEPRASFISALTGNGLRELKQTIHALYFQDHHRYTISLPAADFNPETLSHWAIVLSRECHDGVFQLEILCSRQNMVKFKERHGSVAT